MSSIIKSIKLNKIFDDREILSDFSVNIERGEIYAIIGKNGAGKTTFMKLLTGFLAPTEGEVIRATNKIGVLIENPGLLLGMSGLANLKAKSLVNGNCDENELESILKLVGLERAGNKKVKKYSLGMKQRLGLALALVGGPDLLVLDEPTNGLDPQGIAEFRNLLLKINKELGVTIIISSHILEELSKIASKFAFIHCGKLVKEIDSRDLLQYCQNENINVESYYFSLIGELR